MNDNIINLSGSLVVRELITRLRVKDAMNSTLLTAKPNATLRETQNIMRENKISGVPICDDEHHLVGIVTVDDIIKALDQNYIDATVDNHMTKNIITLEENMPLSLALSYFEKYQFRRFPITDHKHRLTGIISGRDILSKILAEINAEVDKLEDMIPEEKIKSHEFYYRKFMVESRNMDKAGFASGKIKKYCERSGFHRKLVRRIGVAAFELEINLAVHSDGGTLTITRENNKVQIMSQDRGPGIANVDEAMQEGFSTANDWVRSFGFGAGMGLPNIKRVSDQFHIVSTPQEGTTVTVTFLLNGENNGNQSSHS